MKKLYTVNEIAEMWNVHINTVYKYIKEGMPVERFGTSKKSSYRIDVEKALEWVNKR